MKSCPTSVLLALGALTGCSSTRPVDHVPEEPAATAVSSTKAPAPADVPPPLAAIDGDAVIETYIQDAACRWASTTTRQVACVHAELEMGFVVIGLWLHDAAGGVKKLDFYSGSTAFDAAGYKPEILEQANAALRDFDDTGVDVGKGSIHLEELKVTVDARGRTYHGTLAPLEQEHAPAGLKATVEECEHFEVESGVLFANAGLAVVQIGIAHDYTSTDAKHLCHTTEEVNDETFPHRTRTLVLKAL